MIIYSHTRQGYDLLRALGSASLDITRETRGTMCYGHWVLHLVISRLITVLGSGFCDIRHQTGGTTGIGFCIFSYHL